MLKIDKRSKKILSQHFDVFMCINPDKDNVEIQRLNIQPYSCTADYSFSKHMSMKFGSHLIYLFESPGHSRGSLCLIINNKCIFTGYSLVNGKKTITKLPGGSK